MDSDSDDDFLSATKLPYQKVPPVVRRRWNLVGKPPKYIRSLEVDQTIENTCATFEDLPAEIRDLILKHHIGFCDNEDATYYSIFRSRLLASVNTDFWGKMHHLPPIQYQTRSLNSIDIWSLTSAVDVDGDPLEKKNGMWSGMLQLLPHASPKRSVLWNRPPLIDVDLQMSIKSFVNDDISDDTTPTINEVQSTFDVSRKLLQFTCGTSSSLTIEKKIPMKYVETIQRSYVPVGSIEVDEDGDKVIDDEQPRRLLLASSVQNNELKAASFGSSPFTAIIDRSETVVPTLTLGPRKKVIHSIFGQDAAATNTDKQTNYDFCYGIEEMLQILQYPIDEKKEYELSERRARKRAMEMFSKVREIEDEVNISKLMQEHDEESYERTEGKRLKTNGSSSAAGSSSASPVELLQARIHAYLAPKERRYKTQYELLMKQLGGANDAMVLSELNVTEGHLAEIQSMMRAFSD